MKSTYLVISFIITLLCFSCSTKEENTNNENNNSFGIFEREFISSTYEKHLTDKLKINITTTIKVNLDDTTRYPSGVFLIVNQNFRIKNSIGTFDPASLNDTIFISNKTNRTIVLKGVINYFKIEHFINNPEVIVHDKNLKFFKAEDF